MGRFASQKAECPSSPLIFLTSPRNLLALNYGGPVPLPAFDLSIRDSPIRYLRIGMSLFYSIIMRWTTPTRPRCLFYSSVMLNAGNRHSSRKFLSGYGPRRLTKFRRISLGAAGQQGNKPITLLRDGDQPFIYDIKFYNRPYRFQLYDTASPENWTLLHPDVVVLCFDISQRLSMINMNRYVCTAILISTCLY